MKKIIFIVFILGNSLNTFAQTSGKVIYNVTIEDIYKDKTDTKKQIVDFFDEVRKQASNIKLNLIFNKKYSKFQAIKSLPIEGYQMPYGMAKKIISNGVYYQNKDSIKSFRHKTVSGENFFINEDKEIINWEIQKHLKKKIGAFNCMKAIGSFNITNSNSKKENKFNIIAWFTTEIPASYGPLGYGFLPGLILELKQGPITYSFKSFEKLDDVYIKYPKVKKTITSDEFNQRYISAFKNKF